MYPRSPLFTVEKYYERLMHESSKKPDRVFISSFGLNVGLYRKETGEFFSKNSMTRNFLDSLRNVKKVDILIGFPDQRRGEAFKDFSYRRAMFKRALSLWPDYNWKVSETSHLKCVGFEKRGDLYCIVTGGRNLTDSTFDDLSVVIPRRQRPAVKKYFYKFFKEAELFNK